MHAAATHHASQFLGAGMALAGQNDYIEAINKLINITSFQLMTMLSFQLQQIATEMNDQLKKDSDDQEYFSEKWSGDPNNYGLPPLPWPGANEFDAVIAWIEKYGKDPDVNITDTGMIGILEFLALWGDTNGKHEQVGSYLDELHKVYNTDQLHYQNLTSQAQKPVSLWSQTISDENKATGADYTLCKALLSIFKYLNSKTAG